jgi:hypothetical protein
MLKLKWRQDMTIITSKAIVLIILVFSVLFLFASHANAQQEKGDKEVTFFSSGFSIGVGDSSGFSNFHLVGSMGYFITRRNEIGAGTSLSISRSRNCSSSFDANGNLISQSCDTDTDFFMGLVGFYRYNFARKGAKGFPFVGGQIGVSDLTHNFTGNVSARAHVGYKYFLKRNVALDFSVGYSAELNKVKEEFFDRGRQGNINGVLGLTFIF